jgi:hypothetical protein
LDRITAEKLMAIYERLEADMGEANVVISSIPDAEEQKRHRRELGDMINSWVSLQMFVVQHHPELDPDGDQFRKDRK